jgi:three-Cys-motif partner protein
MDRPGTGYLLDVLHSHDGLPLLHWRDGVGGVNEPYDDREQSKAKHFILRHYLQVLALKLLGTFELSYVDGFSGPWKAKTENFSDTSFMIAISVLQDAQRLIRDQRGVHQRIRCFFAETDQTAYAQLERAVAPYHRPEEKFEIKTWNGRFEDAVDEMKAFIGPSFPLIFIDPTGWTGYPFDKIKQLFAKPKCEVLINFMYDHINRFAFSQDDEIVSSFDPILGGPGWQKRLDPSLPPGLALEKLFRETVKSMGGFKHVVSTKIDKSTADRPHFFITYGTKDRAGLIAFRDVENNALREHEKSRGHAKERKRADKSKIADLFPGHQADAQEDSFEKLADGQRVAAQARLLTILKNVGQSTFERVVEWLLEPNMVRETTVKDICVDLAKSNVIDDTWTAGGKRKPQNDSIIRLKTQTK